MSVASWTYSIARGGDRHCVEVGDLDGVIRLGTELVLLERMAGACAAVDVDRFERWVDRTGDSDGAELLQIIRDARDRLNVQALDRLRGDYPSLDEELEMDIIEQESEKMAQDTAQCDEQAKSALVDSPVEALPTAEGGSDSPDDAVAEPMAPSVEAALEGLEAAANVLAEEVGTDPADAPGPDCQEEEPTTEVTAPEPSEAAEPIGEESSCEDVECQDDDTLSAEVADEALQDPVASESLDVAETTNVVVVDGQVRSSQSTAAEDVPEADAVARDTKTVSIDSSIDAVTVAASLLDEHSETPVFERRAVDQMEEGFSRISALFSEGAGQTWKQARTALEQAMAFAEQVGQLRDETQSHLEQVKLLRQEALAEAQNARAHCREVMDSRDDAWRALQRATARVGEVEVLADRAAVEAQRASQLADQVRRAANPSM
ncbi:MAG: hypothetical protein ACE5GE_10965 [Phycisphaerae bacterium]